MRLSGRKLYDNGQLAERIEYVYDNGKISDAFYYTSTSVGSEDKLTRHIQYITNNEGLVIKEIDANYSDPNDEARNETTDYIYENGFIKKCLSNFSGNREIEFYYQSAKLMYAIVRFEVDGRMKVFFKEEYTVNSDGEILEIRYYDYLGSLGKLTVLKQYHYDTYKNPLNIFPGLYIWSYPSNQNHNIVHEKITKYSNSGEEIYEVSFNFTYNNQGYPVKRVATSTVSYLGGMDNWPLTEYFYNE